MKLKLQMLSGIALVILVSSVVIYENIYYEHTVNKITVKSSDRLDFRIGAETNVDTVYPVSKNGFIGFSESVSDIMKRDAHFHTDSIRIQKEFETEELRKDLPQNPSSPYIPRYPYDSKINNGMLEMTGPQTVTINFTGATIFGNNPTNSFPPDDMGAIGPAQFIIDVNGRIVTFDKLTGIGDGVINTSTDNFFNSVRNGSGTSDPKIRYDRLSQRWFLTMINVSTPDRIVIAVSNSAVITAGTVWYFYYINIASLPPAISNKCFADYPTLGIDANALYIGTNNFCSNNYNSTDGYVINKSSILNGGTMAVTVFRGLTPTATSPGPYTPQGVDNFDASATDGYFIGVDNKNFGTLDLIRISNPGGTPSKSSVISLTVPATYYPIPVNHKGNTAGNNGRLDAIDDRLFAATIRNGNLYTAHNIGVINTGVASTTPNRDAARWYQINNLSSTPALVQSGTIFAGGTNDVNQRNYFFPTMMISGQGHIALGFSTAGTNEYANAGTTGRLNNDAAGYTQTPVLFTSSSTAYNPTGDPGTRGARRWGDYSVVSLDPEDDMTMWTAEQFCDATNSYGVRIAKLAAPPPAALSTAVPDVLTGGLTSLSVVITGVSQSGSGFFDPGAGFTKRISASVSNGVIVNSVTYNSPTQVTLNLNTTNLSTTGSVITVSVTNPDGQSSSSSTILSAPLPVNLLAFNSSVQNGNDVLLRWSTSSEIDNSGFDIERKSSTSGWNKIAFIKGNGTTSTVSQYSFADRKLNSGKFSYRLRQIDYNGNFQYLNLSGDVNISLPPKFFISQNYPNPFNPLTKIDFAIPSDANVIIKLYDIRGREIKTIYTGSTTAGYYTVSLSSDDLSSGTYFYRIEALTRIQQFYEIKKLVILK